MIYLVVIICVIGIAAGQILFKLSSSAMMESGGLFTLQTLSVLVPALALYGITTLAWVWALQRIELGKAYPFMALAFVIVPIASHFIFGEKFTTQYAIGVALIVSGILFAVKG